MPKSNLSNKNKTYIKDYKKEEKENASHAENCFNLVASCHLVSQQYVSIRNKFQYYFMSLYSVEKPFSLSMSLAILDSYQCPGIVYRSMSRKE